MAAWVANIERMHSGNVTKLLASGRVGRSSLGLALVGIHHFEVTKLQCGACATRVQNWGGLRNSRIGCIIGSGG